MFYILQVLIKGPTVTKGYYKDPTKTAQLFDEVFRCLIFELWYLIFSGWLHAHGRRWMAATGWNDETDR